VAVTLSQHTFAITKLDCMYCGYVTQGKDVVCLGDLIKGTKRGGRINKYS